MNNYYETWPDHERAAEDWSTRARAAEAKVRAVRDMHVKDRDGWCQACSFAYPCPTIRALDLAP